MLVILNAVKDLVTQWEDEILRIAQNDIIGNPDIKGYTPWKKSGLNLGKEVTTLVIGSTILDNLGENLKALNLSPRVAIVSNPDCFFDSMVNVYQNLSESRGSML